MSDESVYVVMHFKKTWTIGDTVCNGFKRQEKMCEHCIKWIAKANENARPSSWDFVIVEEIVAEGAASECQVCERRKEYLKA